MGWAFLTSIYMCKRTFDKIMAHCEETEILQPHGNIRRIRHNPLTDIYQSFFTKIKTQFYDTVSNSNQYKIPNYYSKKDVFSLFKSWAVISNPSIAEHRYKNSTFNYIWLKDWKETDFHKYPSSRSVVNACLILKKLLNTKQGPLTQGQLSKRKRRHIFITLTKNVRHSML